MSNRGDRSQKGYREGGWLTERKGLCARRTVSEGGIHMMALRPDVNPESNGDRMSRDRRAEDVRSPSRT